MKLGSTQKSVIKTLSSHSSELSFWQDMKSLMKATGLQRTSILRAIKSLIKVGVITEDSEVKPSQTKGDLPKRYKKYILTEKIDLEVKLKELLNA